MNKLSTRTILLLLGLVSIWPLSLQGTQKILHKQKLNLHHTSLRQDDHKDREQAIPKNHVLIQYIPPPGKNPRPEVRFSPGGTRSAKLVQPVRLTLVTPDHVAHTISPQPTLYWHLSRGTDLLAVFTLNELDAIQPLIEKKLPAPKASGFHSIALADIPVELQPNKIYEWSITLINDRATQLPSSGDVTAKAFIKRLPDTAGKPIAADSIAQAKSYAAQGLWYDCLEPLMDQTTSAMNPRVRSIARSILLDQVGLAHIK